MAVDPRTGQTVISQPGFDMKYAGYLDPETIAALQAQQGNADVQSQFADSLMQAGYVPSSGKMGAFAQGLQKVVGALMQKNAISQMQEVSAGQLKAANAAAQLKSKADEEDAIKKEQLAVKQAVDISTGSKEGETKLKLQYGPQLNAQDIALAGGKAKAESDAKSPNEMALEKLRGGYQIQAANISAGSSDPFRAIKEALASGQITQDEANKAMKAKAVPATSELSPHDQAAIDKRIPVLQDQMNKVDTALDIAKNIKTRMQNDEYSVGGATGLYNRITAGHPALQTSGGQELGTDAGNLILAAQAALQGTGSRGSVAQLRILQTSKPNSALGLKANQNAIDSITKELENARAPLTAEADHYGNGGTPATWAQTSVKQPENKPGQLSDADLLKKYGGM